MSSLGEKKKRMSMTARSQRHNLPALLCQLKEEGRVRTMVTEGWSGGVCRVEGRPGEREHRRRTPSLEAIRKTFTTRFMAASGKWTLMVECAGEEEEEEGAD